MEKDIISTRSRNASVPFADVNFDSIFQGSFSTKLQEIHRLGTVLESGLPIWYAHDDIFTDRSHFKAPVVYHGTDHINVIRRKPVAKDNTGALKLWLLQHKKNPYPNKPEKIMLAILSRMTLTQVSTWFANARRRLKKEFPDEDYDIITDALQQNTCYTDH